MAKLKIDSEQAKKNKEAAKVGQRVEFTLGKAQTKYQGEIKGVEGKFVLVLIDGQKALTRVYPSTCFPI